MLCAGVALGFWDTPVIKPFRVFVVMVHEMCHAGVAVATGGEVAELQVRWDESGHMRSRGGFLPLISSAGYVGSAFLGALLIYAGNWLWVQRIVLGGIGVVTIGMAVLYTSGEGFNFVFGLVCGMLLLGVALRFRRPSGGVAAWMGVMLCLYSLYDFRTDLGMYPEQTDAGILARHWGISVLAYPIAFLWAAISVWVMYLAMRGVARRPRADDLSLDDVPPVSDVT